MIEEIGYHCRDYFLAQWERFQNYPGGILAHSTHVKGLGTYDPETGSRDAPHPGDAGHGHLARTLRAHQSRVSRSIRDRPGRVDGGPGSQVVPHAGERLFRVGAPPDAGVDTFNC